MREKLTRDELLKHFQKYYRDKYYPGIILNDRLSESDKAYIRSVLAKLFNHYIFRYIV